MANQEQTPQDDVLTKVARGVGTALGTVASVASAAADMVAGKDESPAPARRASGGRAPSQENSVQARQRERMKAKRTRHRRKLHRKTRG